MRADRKSGEVNDDDVIRDNGTANDGRRDRWPWPVILCGKKIWTRLCVELSTVVSLRRDHAETPSRDIETPSETTETRSLAHVSPVSAAVSPGVSDGQ
jgi:hypothetical protein